MNLPAPADHNTKRRREYYDGYSSGSDGEETRGHKHARSWEEQEEVVVVKTIKKDRPLYPAILLIDYDNEASNDG